MKKKTGSRIVRSTILAAMTTMIVVNSATTVLAEEVVPTEKLEQHKESVTVQTTASEEQTGEEPQSLMVQDDATDAELVEKAAEHAQEQVEIIQEESEKIKDAQETVEEAASEMEEAVSEAESAAEKLPEAETEWEKLQEDAELLEEIKQEKETVDSIIEEVESSMSEDGTLTVEVADEEGTTETVELDVYIAEQAEAVKLAAEQAKDKLNNVLHADENVSDAEIDVLVEEAQKAAEQAKEITQKAKEVYDSAENALKDEIKKYNAYVAVYGEVYGLEPMEYEGEVLVYTEEEQEAANLAISKDQNAQDYRKTLVEINEITDTIETAKEKVEVAEQACIDANEDANDAMDAAFQAKQQAAKYAKQATDTAKEVNESGSEEEKEQVKQAVEKADNAQKQADECFEDALKAADDMSAKLEETYETCMDAKETIAEVETAAQVIAPAKDYQADILELREVLTKKIALWNNIKGKIDLVTQQNTRAQKYAEWTVGMRDSVEAKVYAQTTAPNSGVPANDNKMNYDSSDDSVISRPQESFVEVTAADQTVTVPKEIFQAFAEKMYDVDARWTDGKGVSDGSTMPKFFWEWDAENQKVTGTYYYTEDGSVPDELKGKAFFVGYTFKTEADGYHIDGYINVSQVSSDTNQDPTPSPEPTPEPSPEPTPEPTPSPNPTPETNPTPNQGASSNTTSDSTPVQNVEPTVTIIEEEVPQTVSVPVPEWTPTPEENVVPGDMVTIEEDSVALSDEIPKTGDRSFPSLPFAVGGFGAIAAAVAVNRSRRKKEQ